MGEKTKAAPELMVLLRSAADSADNEWLARNVAEWAVSRITTLESSHAGLLEEVGRLKKLAHRVHTYCEDSWYSCPKAEDGCLNEAQGDDCTCGADKHNAEVEATPTTEEK